MNSKAIFSLLVLPLALAAIKTDVVVQKASSLTDDTQYGCGRNITFICSFTKVTSAISWRYSDEETRIAQCIRKVCDVNPVYDKDFEISVDMTEGIFNLTIIKVKNIGKRLVCSDGSHSDSQIISINGPDVVIQRADTLAYETPSECGRNLTLTCISKKDTFAIVWKNGNDNIKIAECVQNVCSINPDFERQYNISFDSARCIFNLTIMKVAMKDNGRNLVCSDGSHSDSYNITVKDNEPHLVENTTSGTILATSGCISQDTNVSFKWILISESSNIETEFNPEISNKYATNCKNNSDCGNNKHVYYTEIILANGSITGKYYLKVAAIYGNESKDSYYSYKSVMKYMIGEQDEEHLNPVSKNIGTFNVVMMAMLFIFIMIILCAMVLYKLHAQKYRPKGKIMEIT
ncbi:uncharacterized protein LOC132717713 [Ruditapes philippinarum]|uniref:uncharacterized protein LOC132717713 n=1 Tax=Ruditapes philippinarum TaxID=129788 RepID=UPI00295B7723|nr:uncharacterized protein LOC132717713 [Ruditapes philippinarum]